MTEKLRDSINRSDPNVAHDINRVLRFGNVLTGLRRAIRGQVPVALTIVLPNLAKAERVLSAYSRAGGTTGPLAVSATPLTPGAGEVGWTPTGDILFNVADGITSVDVEYEPVVNVEEVTLTGYPVVADTLTLPASAFTMSLGTTKGLTERGPLSMSLRRPVSIVSMPPMPEPIATP